MAKIKITEQQARLLGLKPNVKVKITKEQYNRIFASGLIKENDTVRGGLTRVDKAFKKEFAGGDVKNLKETDFNIQKANPSIPKSIQGKFNKPMSETSDNLKKETADLIKYMYRKDENFSPFWGERGLSYEDICDALVAKKMVVAENGKCTVSKSLGDPQTAIQMIENALREMIGGDKLMELDNYPAGAEFDSRAPYNQSEPNYTKPFKAAQTSFELIAMGGEIAILKGQDGLYVFYHDDLGEDELGDYTEREQYFIGKDEDGDPEYEYGEFEKTPEGVESYINDNLGNISTGEGLASFEDGVELVKIDDELKNNILSLYDKDKEVVKVLNPINEVESEEDRMTRIKKAIADKRAESDRLEAQRQARLDQQNAIDSARAEEKMKMQQAMDANEPEEPKSPETFFGTPWDQVEETTTAASSGSFVAPMGMVNKREMPVDVNKMNVPVVKESTMSVAVGDYDISAIPSYNRDGSIKKVPKTKAQTNTQYADGAFVEFNDCTKLNNKPAGTGCSQGAVDKVIKLKKTKGNISAPSLSEGKSGEKQ
jgi:hypothetical protein